MAEEEAGSRRWAYVGVGCLTSVIGFTGGAMIAVFVAKIVGAFRGCVPDAETGAPCDWFVYAVGGALLGLVSIPTIAIWRMRSGEARALASGNSETG